MIFQLSLISIQTRIWHNNKWSCEFIWFGTCLFRIESNFAHFHVLRLWLSLVL